MNCARCNTPLEPHARFCRVCGLPVSAGAASTPGASPYPDQASQPTVVNSSPTVPTAPWQGAQPTQPARVLSQRVPPVQPTLPQAYQPAMGAMPGTLRSEGVRPYPAVVRARRRRRFLRRTLISLLVIALVLALGWFFGLRPYLHGLAQSQLDGVLANAVNQIDTTRIAQLPPGPVAVPVSETMINNLFVLFSAPSDPVQQFHMSITPAGLRLDFRAYGFPCDITGVPTVSNGQLMVTNVNVEGIVSLIMSSDEMTSIVNRHLHDASAKLQRNVKGVLLRDREMDILLS